MTGAWFGPQIEFGRVQLCSWEHDWATSCWQNFTSLRDAQRVIPVEVTGEIYALLRRDEVRLLRGSLPFTPYDFRVRLENNRPGDHSCLRDEVSRVYKIGIICPCWSEALREAGLETEGNVATKKGRYKTLRVAGADTQFSVAYSLEWRPISVP